MDRKSPSLFFRRIGDIFIPLLPGFIIAGVCSGFASLLAQLKPDYQQTAFWYGLFTVLSVIGASFNTYLSAWVGYSAAKSFGATPVLGGMLGMVTNQQGIDTLSSLIGLYRPDNPASSILHAGSGGVLTVIFGAWAISLVEKRLRRVMPKSLDAIFTPFVAFVLCLLPYIFICMPLLGFVSNGLCIGIGFLCSNTNLAVSLFSGYICAALFLPASLLGLQFGFIALYATQLEETGSVSLYPVLAMAGASQVGTGIAVFLKARRAENHELQAIAASGILPGMLGIGTALLYGVTVPHSKAFLTTCIGAGFGGAFIVATKVASTGWGPSGLLALPLMTAGAGSPLESILHYLMGLCIACIAGFVLTSLFVRQNDLT